MDGHDEPRAAALPPGRGDRLRALAPAALLVVVAALGTQRAITIDQSSWKGASFGMFATYDNDASRMVRVYVERPDGVVRAALPESLRDDSRRLRVTPTQGAAVDLAEATLTKVSADGATGVLVEVWRIRVHDRDGELRLRTELLTSGWAHR